MDATLTIRAATAADDDAIWAILGPSFRAGETYPLPRDISRAEALAYWRSPGHAVFVAQDKGAIVGTYYLRANQRGGGSHVANCGYIVAGGAWGRGVALWQACGFAIVGRLPAAFQHPNLGPVDALVMHRSF